MAVRTRTARYEADIHQCRVLAALAINERGLSMDDLLAWQPLADLERVQLERAVADLILGERVGRRIAAVRYRQGDAHIRRDVAVYYVIAGGGE